MSNNETIPNKNGKFRTPKVYFSQVSNTALRDEMLSLKAKGLYALIQSYITMENFTLYKGNLMSQCKEKRDSFNSAWKELKDRGYLVQYRLRDEKEKTFYYEYELLNIVENNTEEQKEPCTEKPYTENPVYGDAECGKPGIYNNTNNNNTKSIVVVEGNDDLKLFEENICKLRPITKKKFLEYLKTYGSEFVTTVIEIAADGSINRFSGFEKIANSYINKGKLKRKQILEDREKIRLSNDKKKNNKNISGNRKVNKTSNFNDYKQREYDFDDLEDKLVTAAKSDVETENINGEDMLAKIRNKEI